MILVDKEIKALAQAGMITPFNEGTRGPGIVSYGLAPNGYDVKLSRKIKRLKYGITGNVLDVKQSNQNDWLEHTHVGDHFVLYPGEFVLGVTEEYFKVPKDVSITCMGKSTYARVGVHILTTPVNPTFEGNVVIEMVNFSAHPVKIYFEGIAFFEFTRTEGVSEVAYADIGKYQGQTGVELSKA